MQAIGCGVPDDVPADVKKKLDDAFNKTMKFKKVVKKVAAFLSVNYCKPIGRSGKDAAAIFAKLESLFCWTLWDLGQAKNDPASLEIPSRS